MEKFIKPYVVAIAVVFLALFFLLSWVISIEGYRCDRVEYLGFPMNLLGLFCYYEF